MDAGQLRDIVAYILGAEYFTSNVGWPLMRGLPVRFVLYPVFVLLSVVSIPAGFAEKMVNPDLVAPEFRAAAEKRRAEQIKLFACNKKADAAKVLRRDRADFVGQCLEK